MNAGLEPELTPAEREARQAAEAAAAAAYDAAHAGDAATPQEGH